MFSSFYLKKLETELKNLQHCSHTIALGKMYYICVCTYVANLKYLGRGGGGGNSPSPPPISKRTPKKPTQIRVKAYNFIKKSLSHSCFSVKFLTFSKLRFLNPSMTNAFPHLEISMRHFHGGWFKFCSINSGNKFCSESDTKCYL